MTKLIQTSNPASDATWIEEFYEGHLVVVNNLVETDNPTWVETLLGRGFEIVEGDLVSPSA